MTPILEPRPVRLSSPADLVGAIPSFVGFHPAESLVMVGLHGPRSRNGAALRADLPDPAFRHEFVADLVDRIAREDPDAVVAVCFTEQADSDGRLPEAGLIDQLLDQLDQRGIAWLELLLVRDGRWFSYTCFKPCCPADGTPLPDSPSSEVTELEARRALSGAAVLPDRDALAKSIAGPVALRLVALRQLFDETAARLPERMLDDGLEQVRSQALGLARGMLERFVSEGCRLDDADAVHVLLCLQDKWLRDRMIAWSVDTDLREFLAFLTALAQRAVDEHAAPICTVLATVAYQDGQGALAAVALERALRHDPEYEMALILDTLLSNHIHPREIRTMAVRARRVLEAPVTGNEQQAA
ncbi:DUF4192 domain-containing protein [Phytoactinopolyspora mesophila]|uniref:DUF4192 family protein n=1 Tax=Phytoactinopolyspora mesophila TaxID=2650750 RepID=A0A7K3M5B9_9ACTN|nr:DUF4192 domain-containing protein [Phytoactinopolyspora mesophila]NDL58435.1 DUF4192 family protein [Phytoactinopolyspora mesophila]